HAFPSSRSRSDVSAPHLSPPHADISRTFHGDVELWQVVRVETIDAQPKVRYLGRLIVASNAATGPKTCHSAFSRPALLFRRNIMPLNDASLKLIIDFEVAGGEQYYDKHLQSPVWPGAASGVTIGVGYDLGYNSPATITSDWEQHLDQAVLAPLLATAGKTGQNAKAALASVKDIKVPWSAAFAVFQAVTIPKFTNLARNTFPGFDDLDPNCQGALVSLVFNRGGSLDGPRRVEMRAIRDLVPHKDYAGIAQQIRKMKRLWIGTDVENGMSRRRDAEADLVLKSQG